MPHHQIPDPEAGNVVRVLIVDDHPMVREGLRSMISARDVEVVGEAGSGLQALEKVQDLRPDVVLMDVRMPDLDGLSATAQMKKEHPETTVLIVTSYENVDYLKTAIVAGASGYILKGTSRATLLSAIRAARSGDSLIEGPMLRRLVQQIADREQEPETVAGLESLTRREVDVLRLLAHGLTNKEIAARMQYSVGTVKNAVQSIIEKLAVSDRTQAAVLAVRVGLLSDTAEDRAAM